VRRVAVPEDRGVVSNVIVAGRILHEAMFRPHRVVLCHTDTRLVHVLSIQQPTTATVATMWGCQLPECQLRVIIIHLSPLCLSLSLLHITVADAGCLPEKQSPKKGSHGEDYTASTGTYYQEKNDRSGPGTSC